MKKIHLYQLSKLAYAEVPTWASLLRQLDSEKKHRVLFYRPLRQAIVSLIQSREQRDKIEQQLSISASAISHICCQHSVEAFDCFANLVLPRIAGLSRDLMEDTRRSPQAVVGGISMLGGPHVQVQDTKGNARYLYLHASKDWQESEIKATCELLCEVLSQTYGAAPQGLWFVDLHNSRIVTMERRRSTVMKRCEQAAKMWLALETSHAA